MADAAEPGGGPLRHIAVLCDDPNAYLGALARAVFDGLEAGEAVLVALPALRAAALRGLLGAVPRSVEFADLTALGQNPARILPAMQAFARRRAGRPARIVSEPVWPGRGDAETREAIRHEALVNLAFDRERVTVLCGYDASALPEDIRLAAASTHPLIGAADQAVASTRYGGPGTLPGYCDEPLPPPPGDAAVLPYETDLRGVRLLVAEHAARAGLPPARAADLVLAVSEVTANTLTHTAGGGLARAWVTPHELICEVSDSGRIRDPLAWHRLPDPDHRGGHGLWLINQLCDLAEVRTGRRGTTIRLHMGRTAPANGLDGHGGHNGHVP